MAVIFFDTNWLKIQRVSAYNFAASRSNLTKLDRRNNLGTIFGGFAAHKI